MSRSTVKDPAKSKSSETFFKVLRFIGRYRFLLILSIILAAVSVILQLYVPILFGNAIDQVIAQHQVNFEMMWYYLSRILVMVILSSAATWLMNVINNRMTYQTVKDIRAKAIRHIQVLPLSYLDGHSTGDIISRIIADTDILSDGMLLGFTQLFSGIVTIIGTLIFMFSKNFWITLMVIVLTPVSFLVAKFISSHTFQMFRKQSDARGRQTALIEEMIGNQKIVQAFSHEDEALEQFDEINDRLQSCSLRATFFSSLTNPCTRFVNSLVYAGVALTGALSVISGGMSVGGLSCFLSYANQYTKPFNEISGVITELQNALACAARIFELIEEDVEIPDDADAVILDQVEGKVTLKDVDFSYLPEQKLIEHLNLDVKPGQTIAIVGPTGCGKTTLINLLMRFYDVNAGAVCVEDQDIRHVTRDSLRLNYGMVLQDTWLFEGTIRENICYGEKNISDERLDEICEAVGLLEMIHQEPEGYDTVLDDKASLSIGQKQLITIARAMVEDAPLMILDEATSSVDTRTELKVQKAMDLLTEGRTSFVIAHRLSTIRNADLILVMKDGDVIESGNHEELLKRQGFYAALYNSQFEEASTNM